MAAREDVQTQMVSLGLPGEIIDTVLEAIDAAGYELTPTAGGSPVAPLGSVAMQIKSIDGRPGWFLLEVEVASGVFARTIEVQKLGQATPVYVPLGPVSDASGVSP